MADFECGGKAIQKKAGVDFFYSRYQIPKREVDIKPRQLRAPGSECESLH
jgi:hypothetical protein